MSGSRARGVGAATVALLGAVLLGGGWLLGTAGGARFALERLAGDGRLVLRDVRGALLGGLSIGGLEYSDERIRVATDGLTVELSPQGLLTGRLVVDSLRVGVVGYRRVDRGRDGPRPIRRWPVPIRVRRASIDGLESADGDLPTFGRLTSSFDAGGTEATIQRLETWWQGRFLSVHGDVSWGDGLGLDLIVSWFGEVDNRQSLGSVDFDHDGRFALAAMAGDWSLELGGEGAFVGGAWAGLLTSGTLGNDTAAAWRLAAAAPLTVSAARIEIADACLRRGDREFCASWTYETGRDRLELAGTGQGLVALADPGIEEIGEWLRSIGSD